MTWQTDNTKKGRRWLSPAQIVIALMVLFVSLATSPAMAQEARVYEAQIRRAFETAQTAEDEAGRLAARKVAVDQYAELRSFLRGRGQRNAEIAADAVASLEEDGLTFRLAQESVAAAYADYVGTQVASRPDGDFRELFFNAIDSVLSLPSDSPVAFDSYMKLADSYLENGNSYRATRMVRQANKHLELAAGSDLSDELLTLVGTVSGRLGRLGLPPLYDVLSSEMPPVAKRKVIMAWGQSASLPESGPMFRTVAEMVADGVITGEDVARLDVQSGDLNDWRAVMIAAMASDNQDAADQLLRRFTDRLLASRRLHQAESLLFLAGSPALVSVDGLKIADAYRQRGYHEQAATALERAYAITDRLGQPAVTARLDAFALAYGYDDILERDILAVSAAPASSQRALERAGAYRAMESGDGRQAARQWQRDAGENADAPSLRDFAALAIVLGNEEFLDFLSSSEFAKLAVEMASERCHTLGKVDRRTACESLQRLVGNAKEIPADVQARGYLRLALYGSRKAREDALDELGRIEAIPTNAALEELVRTVAGEETPEAFASAAGNEGAVGHLADMAAHFARMGDTDKSLELIAMIASDTKRDQAYAEVLPLLILGDRVADVLLAGRNVVDDRVRMVMFRHLAELRAATNDVYGLLPADVNLDTKIEKQAEVQLGGDLPIATLDNTRLYRDENSPRLVQRVQNVRVYENVGGVVDFSKIALPDRMPPRTTKGARPDLMISEQWQVREIVPAIDPGLLDVSLMRYNGYNSDFFEEVGETRALRDLYFETQGQFEAQSIQIDNGVFDLTAVDELLDKAGLPDAMEFEGNRVYLRRPILIGENATLVISGNEIDEVNLSTEDAAFIVNAGTLFVVDTEVVAFNESTGTKTDITYENRRTFRPFITSWSDSETYMTNSVIYGLGYAGGKSYGISMSAGPTVVTKNTGLKERPTGALIDNTLIEMFYGYYSYEADHVDLIGNEYKDNIVYGIDPHDRSRDLRIGYNTAYGTKVKHGIIVSREVDNSYIFGNVSFANVGSGFMVDRDSTGNLVYANESYRNKQDGITFFESACAIISNNLIAENERGGVILRNSWDAVVMDNIIRKNAGSAIQGYTSILEETKAARTRDFDLDPYAASASFAAIGNHIEDNAIGINSSGSSHFRVLDNAFVDQPKPFEGDAKDFKTVLARGNYTDGAAVESDSCPPPPPAEYWQGCRWEDNGVFSSVLTINKSCRVASPVVESATGPATGATQ